METQRARTAYEKWDVGPTVAEALGTVDRPDPVLPRSGGPAGNARLTAWVGVVLFVLLAVEGVTLIDVRGLITWHIVVGALLVPPAVLKTVTTGWRMVRYYVGTPSYQVAGPPPLPLRLLGPLVVLSTLGLLATGIAVGVLGPDSGRGRLWGTPISPLFLHQATFAVWIVVMTLHVLGRLVPAVRIVTGRVVGAAQVDGRAARIAAIVLAVGLAAWVAQLVLTGSSAWQHDVVRNFGLDH